MNELIRVFCAGAVKSALSPLLRNYLEQSGHQVQCVFGSTGVMQDRVASGEPADLVLLNRSSITRLIELGKVQALSTHDLGRVGVAIAVQSGAPHPDIGSESALRATLLAAASLSFGDPDHGDSSGIHFSKVLTTLGLNEVLRDKIVLAPLGLAVVEYVQQGKAALGATQSSVILAGVGVELVGLLPASLQQETTYTLGITVGASMPALELADYLISPNARSVFASAGFAQGVA